MIRELPELETQCPACVSDEVHEGRRGAWDEGAWHDCWKCNGTGFVPTAEGKAILDLIRHNSRVRVTAEYAMNEPR